MSEELVIPLCALAIPIVIVPTALFYKHLQRKGELRHKERMRALELGYPHPQGSFFWPSVAAVSIGAGVPTCSVLFAFLTTLIYPRAEDVWTSAAFVGVAGVIGGSILGTKLITGSLARWHGEPRPDVHEPSKPQLDPDIYDTVGRRG